jgi:cytidylate kinase
MVAIAMTREMGTLGKDVAQGIADALGLTVVHSELVEHDLAQRLGMKDSAVHRYLEGSASLVERWKIDKVKLSRYTAEEIIELAQQGNVVIRGWGSVAVLREVPHVLRVRVCAPMSFREQVMMERLGTSDRAVVCGEIARSDAAHARVIRQFFDADWENPLLYHVVLNTGTVPVASCVRILRQLADEPSFVESEATRAMLADKLIEQRVRDELSKAGINASSLEVEVSQGRVILSGAILQADAPLDIEGAARSVAGVTAVENRVRVVRTARGSL